MINSEQHSLNFEKVEELKDETEEISYSITSESAMSSSNTDQTPENNGIPELYTSKE